MTDERGTAGQGTTQPETSSKTSNPSFESFRSNLINRLAPDVLRLCDGWTKVQNAKNLQELVIALNDLKLGAQSMVQAANHAELESFEVR